MSMVGMVGSAQQQAAKPSGPARADTAARVQEERFGEASRIAVPSGGAAPAERTAAPAEVRQLPPPAEARAVNRSADARPGGDGSDAAVSAREAMEAADRAADVAGARVVREERAAQDRLLAQEIVARIPVPVEALPRLDADARIDLRQREAIGAPIDRSA